MASNVFPAIIKATYDPSGGFPKMVQDAQSASNQIKRQFESDFGQIANLAREALAIPRNAGGSLDINVEEYKQAAQAARAHAIALREIATAAATAQKASGDTTRATQTYVQAASAAAREADEQAKALNATAISYERLQAELNKTRSATDAVIVASGRGTTAYQANTQSVRAMRQATVQAGQQLQDIVISMGSGQRASTVLAQQLPQLAFAFSDVGGKVGTVARFLAGPWGVAVAIGAFALGPLIDGLFKTEEASDSATKSNYDFTRSFDVTKIAINEVAGAMAQLNQQITGLIEGNKLLADSALVTANSSLKGLESQLTNVDDKIAALQSRIAKNSSTGFGQIGNVPLGFELNKLIKQRGTMRQDVAEARENVVLANIAASQLKVNEARDKGTKALNDYIREVRRLRTLREQGARNEMDPMVAVQANIDGTPSISAAEYEKALSAAQDRLEASKSNPDRGGAGGTSAGGGASRFSQDAAKETERLSRISDSAAESILRINEQFDDQPRLVDQSAQAVRRLRDVIAEINDPKNSKDGKSLIPRAKELERDAEAAITRAGNAISTDFDRQTEQFQNRLKIQRLILAGRSEEAQVVERIQQLEERYGLAKEIEKQSIALRYAKETLATEEATNDEREKAQAIIDETTPAYNKNLEIQRKIYDTVARQTAQEIALNNAIDKRNQSIARYQSVVDGTYRSLEDLLSGGKAGDFFKSIRDQFKQLAGQNLAESLFGDAFRELRRFTERNNPENVAVERLVEATNKTSAALTTFTDALLNQGGRITAANDNAALGAGSSTNPRTQEGVDGNDEILVTANIKKAIVESNRYNYGQFASQTARAIIDPFLAKLDVTFGTNFFGQLSGVLTGALAGYAQAGKVGGALGGAKGIVDKLGEATKGQGKSAKVLSDVSMKLGQALGGAQTGDQTAQLLRSFGVKTSRTGGQIGGAIGSFIPGLPPGVGQIVGSVIGSIGGGMLKKTKTGTLVLNSASSDVRTSGKLGGELTGAGNSIQDQLKSIADQLGGSVGNFAVSIGKRGDYFRVSGSGATNVDTKKTRNINNLIYDGKDEAEATRIALLNAIQDGAIKGIREGSQRLLQAGKDMSAQLQKALKFQSVFDRLDAIKDPVGSAIRSLNKEFTGLIGIFNEAGASAEEFAALEELYGLERAKAIKDTSESLTSSLRGLIDELTKGDSGLSLRDRLSNIRADFNPMADTIRQGGKVDYDRFTELARQLIEVQREISGSQTDYFSTFDEVLALSRQALAGQENVVSIGSNTASPFSGGAAPSNAAVPVVNAINAQTGELMAGFAALTAQVAQLRVASGGGGPAMFLPPRDYF
jgi:hypothetical protein